MTAQVHANSLIGASMRETIESSSDALNALAVLLSNQHSDLAMLIEPIRAAIEVAAKQ